MNILSTITFTEKYLILICSLKNFLQKCTVIFIRKSNCFGDNSITKNWSYFICGPQRYDITEISKNFKNFFLIRKQNNLLKKLLLRY